MERELNQDDLDELADDTGDESLRDLPPVPPTIHEEDLREHPEHNPQGGMFDVIIDDPALVDAIKTIIFTADEAKSNRKARKLRKDILAEHELKNGDRVRCGPYTFDIRRRDGGPTEIPEWSALTAGAPTTA